VASVGAAAQADLLDRMREPHRHYHDLGHLTTLWLRHRELSPAAGLAGARSNRLIACAIAFHDSVYVAGAPDNEMKSAALWRTSAPGTLAADDIDWVTDTILCTADHFAPHPEPADPALRDLRCWLLDLDLTPLGETPEAFAADASALWAEWQGADPAAFQHSQRMFLRRVAAHPRIFRSPVLFDRFETLARANIETVLRNALP
jgi:predicted metal-dependent HD superfamily phosphohydrolase